MPTWSRTSSKNTKINYSIININNSTKEKICIQSDKDNDKKYRTFSDKAAQASKKWENTGAKMNLEVPKPPKPNNYERLIKYNKQHVLRPAIEQSKATIYLNKHGYELSKDYEAYQAIELAESLKIYSSDLKRQKSDKRKSKLEDLLKVGNMNITRRNSNNSIDIDEYISRDYNSSPSNSSISSTESLSNSMEFKKQSDLLSTINEFRDLETRNNTNHKDLLPQNKIQPTAPYPSLNLFNKD
tara:strand:+ start:99 stop:824 length:726 start_codon:yes stop_codon:yes gene_type:complete